MNQNNVFELKRELADWIRHILTRKDWTPTELARHSRLAPSTVIRLLGDPNYEFSPTLRTLRKLSDGSGYPIPSVILDSVANSRPERLWEEAPQASAPEPPPELRPEPAPARPPAQPQPRPAMALPVRQFALYHRSLGPLGDEDVEVRRPDFLIGDGTAFAFYMPDDSLEPWYPQGTEMYATRRRPPRPGRDLVVVTMKDDKAKVSLLRGVERENLRVESASDGAGAIPLDNIEEIAVVVGTRHI